PTPRVESVKEISSHHLFLSAPSHYLMIPIPPSIDNGFVKVSAYWGGGVPLCKSKIVKLMKKSNFSINFKRC
ncbi:MAG: hypothetical protein M0Q92_13800, partial [Methanoregula sp.]|nr:hypothetical protein [Methanoregula sp.]